MSSGRRKNSFAVWLYLRSLIFTDFISSSSTFFWHSWVGGKSVFLIRRHVMRTDDRATGLTTGSWRPDDRTFSGEKIYLVCRLACSLQSSSWTWLLSKSWLRALSWPETLKVINYISAFKSYWSFLKMCRESCALVIQAFLLLVLFWFLKYISHSLRLSFWLLSTLHDRKATPGHSLSNSQITATGGKYVSSSIEKVSWCRWLRSSLASYLTCLRLQTRKLHDDAAVYRDCL